ncbi:uncharacterized protein ARMOST_21889 [Armillaria ostoyae]|uniref:Uncharacterized protein n=1 Tax=Armillaria ostoyae TaxID=47428 RepID=A0A284SBB3_ARMOS|nr:uncharacterized protein ARMOST_21889 [Armillaria ostoyae]
MTSVNRPVTIEQPMMRPDIFCTSKNPSHWIDVKKEEKSTMAGIIPDRVWTDR